MNCWSSKNFLCPSPLLIFYLNEGAEVNYHWIIAYARGKPFKQFIDGQTAARIQSDIENKPGKSKLHKDISNSSYGRLSMNLSKRTNLQHGSGAHDNLALKSRYLKYITPLFCEDDSLMSFEYTLKKKGYVDSIPVHIGCFILATSKLHLLEVKISSLQRFKMILRRSIIWESI